MMAPFPKWHGSAGVPEEPIPVGLFPQVWHWLATWNKFTVPRTLTRIIHEGL
jgi:hypothetical protein